jgi:hypothetical protein
LLNGNLKVVENTQNITSELDTEKVKQCTILLDYLANNGCKNKKIFPTVLKWAIISPFSFSIKFNSNEWIPWLQLYGCGQSGKTTLGEIILRGWNLDKRRKSRGFNNINSVARFGHEISKDIYPVLVNEVGLLSINHFGKYTSIIELTKHSVENITCRGKYFEGKNYQEILALSPMILTSNYSPPNDGAFNRRFISIPFPIEEKKEIEEQAEFKNKFNEYKDSLSVLGDFTARHIIDNPSLLTTKKWTDIAKDILVHFYDFAKVSIPDWIDLFEEQRDVIDESSEKTHYDLRSFLLNTINDIWIRHKKLDHSEPDPNVISKLDFCLDQGLISFLSKSKDNALIITHDIITQIKKNGAIENITSLRDIGDSIGFEYVSRYVNSKKMRVLEGARNVFVEFVDSWME